jgi:hypothetical protein
MILPTQRMVLSWQNASLPDQQHSQGGKSAINTAARLTVAAVMAR